jgi:peroxiredoxin
LELQALQRKLSGINELGANLIAISPQLPDQSLDLTAKTNLEFDVLHDPGNKTAREFGLVFTLAQELKPVYAGFGIDLPRANGDESFELPMPATYVIGQDGSILYDFVDTNHTKRLEPDLIVAALKK